MSRNDAEILLKIRDEFSGRIAEASKQLDQLAANARKSATANQAAMKQTSQAIVEAGVAARGLGRELGVTIPESLSRLASRSSTIGPILSKAFSAVAVIGFIQVVKEIPNAIDEAAGAITGWN